MPKLWIVSDAYTGSGYLHQAAKDPDNTIYLLGFVAPATTVKAIIACLASDKPTKFRFEDVEGPGYWHTGKRDVAGYRSFKHDMGHNTYHCVLVSKDPTFMASVDEESLWHRLSGPQFTTPILRRWIPAILRETLNQYRSGFLQTLHCFNCNCGLLLASDEDLDTAVSNGLKSGALTIGTRICTNGTDAIREEEECLT